MCKFPPQLVEVVEFLSGLVDINGDHADGRVNSIADEATVIRLLKGKYGDDVELPRHREFFDVRIFGYPVQIKSSAYHNGSSDNFSSKAAVLYALTEMSESEIIKVQRWVQFETALKQYANAENNRDYYIISVNKDDSSVHLSSLKSLKKLTPNGNNLPFQIQWKNNIEVVDRTYDEAYEFIVGAYKKSVERKIAAHKLFDSL